MLAVAHPGRFCLASRRLAGENADSNTSVVAQVQASMTDGVRDQVETQGHYGLAVRFQ